MKEAGVPVPLFGTSPSDAGTGTILARTRRGSKGRGITVVQPGECPPPAELYVQFIPNVREFRVHIFKGEAIRIQLKCLDFPERHTNSYVKNHEQGYVFKTPAKNPRPERIEAAAAAVEALGLDFGAVDLIVGEDDKTYVLEVNSAPSCSPMTARAYVDKFAEELGIEPDYTRLDALART
jgi:glutathione synthase/RimK-type ligase-like ATP-grasp enzyme